MSKRETGIELLRIICMIMVVYLHLLSYSGLLYGNVGVDLKSSFIWILEAFCLVAVNCYVLIGSYFLVDKKFSIKRIIKLFIQVLFYSVLIFIIMVLIFKVKFNKTDIFRSLLPVLGKNYWFVTIYIGLCIFSPFLNIFIKNITKKQYKMLLIVMAFMFSVWPFIVPFSTNLEFGGAYSIVWFINLYLIAGYLKKHFDINKYKKSTYLLTYLVSSSLLFIITYIIRYFKIHYFSEAFFYSYNFIIVVFASIGLFLFFKKLNIKSNLINKIILFFSSLTFGVYLIHENPFVRNKLWGGPIGLLVRNQFSVPLVISMGLCIYITLSILDYIRNLIFIPINKKITNSRLLNKFDDVLLDEILESSSKNIDN